MVKSFNVIGIPNASIMYRGMFLTPKKEFNVIMSESEFDFFKDYFEVINCTEVADTLKPQPEIKPQIEKEVEQPKEKENVSKQSTKSNAGRSKTTNKTKV